MSDSVSQIIADLNAEIPVLELLAPLDPTAQTELTADEQGLALENDIAALDATIALGGDNPTIDAQLAADQAQLADITLTLCFAQGTHILTERGEIPVEHLSIGDWVVTPYGADAVMPIRWIGRQHREGDAARFSQPVRVRAGALGNGFPHRDLLLSGDHCLFMDGRLVPAKLLVNGNTILTERGHESIDYFNLEFDRHSVVLAEGVASETYLDCGNRHRFDNADAPSDWLSTRPAGTEAAWTDGTAFAPPLWDGPELKALVNRLAASDEKLAA